MEAIGAYSSFQRANDSFKVKVQRRKDGVDEMDELQISNMYVAFSKARDAAPRKERAAYWKKRCLFFFRRTRR